MARRVMTKQDDVRRDDGNGRYDLRPLTKRAATKRRQQQRRRMARSFRALVRLQQRSGVEMNVNSPSTSLNGVAVLVQSIDNGKGIIVQNFADLDNGVLEPSFMVFDDGVLNRGRRRSRQAKIASSVSRNVRQSVRDPKN